MERNIKKRKSIQDMPHNAGATAARLFKRLKGQRVRLGVVAFSIVVYVALSIWNPMYSVQVG